MRWLKHLSLAHLDQRMIDLLARRGPSGYGCYWLILEMVAAKMGSGSIDTSISHFLNYWCSFLRETPKSARQLFRDFEDLGMMTVTFEGSGRNERITVDVPKLLKYRDEYHSKVGKSGGSDSGDDSSATPALPARARQNRTELEQNRTRSEGETTTTTVSDGQKQEASPAAPPELSSSPSDEGKIQLPDKRMGRTPAQSNGHGPHAKDVLNAARMLEMKSTIWGYMVPDGEAQESVPEPTESVITRCLIAVGDTPMETVYRWLRKLRNEKGQGPGTTSGPRAYSWFPKVLESLVKTGGPV